MVLLPPTSLKEETKNYSEAHLNGGSMLMNTHWSSFLSGQCECRYLEYLAENRNSKRTIRGRRYNFILPLLNHMQCIRYEKRMLCLNHYTTQSNYYRDYGKEPKSEGEFQNAEFSRADWRSEEFPFEAKNSTKLWTSLVKGQEKYCLFPDKHVWWVFLTFKQRAYALPLLPHGQGLTADCPKNCRSSM